MGRRTKDFKSGSVSSINSTTPLIILTNDCLKVSSLSGIRESLTSPNYKYDPRPDELNHADELPDFARAFSQNLYTL